MIPAVESKASRKTNQNSKSVFIYNSREIVSLLNETRRLHHPSIVST